MKKLLLTLILVSLVALSGCSTVYTPGTRDLPATSVGELTASNAIGGYNLTGYLLRGAGFT